MDEVTLDDYFAPWLVANMLALTLLFFCWKYPKVGRVIYGLIFFLAFIINTVTAFNDPKVYLDYGQLTFLGLYESFIYGYFADNTQVVVLSIALGQLFISIGILFDRQFFRPALLLAMLFFVAILPLGIGSAFPAPLIMLISLILLYSKKRFDSPKSIVT